MGNRWRLLRPEDAYQLVYLAVTGVMVLTHWGTLESPALHLWGRVGMASFILVVVPLGQRRPSLLTTVVRDFYVVPAFLAYYLETAILHRALWGGATFDGAFAAADQALFGLDPSREFSRAFANPWFGEAMHFCYSFYFFLALGAAVGMWLRQDRGRAFTHLIHSASLALVLGYALFVVVPVVGPQFYWADLADWRTVPGLASRALTGLIMDVEVPTGAFPSGHAALTTIVMLALWTHARRIFFMTLLPALGIGLSTVYLRAHYFVDVPAGILVGALAWRVGPAIREIVATRAELQTRVARPGEPL